MSSRPIYLDYAAATPLDERVLAVMLPYLTEKFYNPSAAYMAARSVRADFETARHLVAGLLGAKSSEIIFTAGASESISLAINGILAHYPEGQAITTTIEHPAVLRAAEAANSALIVPVKPNGQVALETLRDMITDDTVLVSIGFVNNEIGTIQRLREIAGIITDIRQARQKADNKLPIYLHTDASQAGGHLDLHVSRLGVDLMTLNAGKMYGPKQVGLLYVASHVDLLPQIHGGGQERNLRSGTENVAGVIGFAEAFRIAETERGPETKRLQGLRQLAIELITSSIADAEVNGDTKRAAPHIVNISIPGIDGERLLMECDERGIMLATGSACAANSDTKSHVLEAIGLEDELISGSIRLSFGRETSEQDVRDASAAIIELVGKQRTSQHV
jgi:cysteine desulfurase